MLNNNELRKPASSRFNYGLTQGILILILIFSMIFSAGVQTTNAQGFGPGIKWHDWFCIAQEIPAVGDFNGDARDDIVTFVRDTQSGQGRGDVFVALSDGNKFVGTALKWHDLFCISDELPAVGDFNGDGKDDIATFTRGNSADVYVALSNGSQFVGTAVKWHDSFCYGQEVPAVGDFNGDGKDDIVTFVRDTKSGQGRGDVFVALSDGSKFVGTALKWHDLFCIGDELPAVGDFNGDGKDDIATFTRGNNADVFVALSNGSQFAGTAIKWHDSFCYGEEVPAVGDFNADGKDDIVTFVRDTKSGQGRGDVFVALSDGSKFVGTALKWHDWFCIGQEVPTVGRFDGDLNGDIITFVRDTQSGGGQGDVYVAVATAPISEGKLYRGSSSPEVYVIHSGKKIWIPTPDALAAMGYDWSQVTVVPDGALKNYPRINIPSSSPTPGSLVFPPNGVKYFPLKVVPAVTTIFSQGKEVQLAELYGWLRGVEDPGDGCGDGTDFHYYLEIDTEWAIQQGIDLNQLLRVGNVVIGGIMLPGFSPRRAVSFPTIIVELNSWEKTSAGHPVPFQKPGDWKHVLPCGGTNLTFPFDPLQPSTSKPGLNSFNWDINTRGPYVRMVGSLLTDSPHDVQHRIGTILSRYFAITPEPIFEWEGSVPDWHPGVNSEGPDHFARWTEMHPPDLIEVLDWKEPRFTVRAVALCARVGWLPFGLSNACETVEFDIFPEAQRPASSQIAYQELRGPECYFPWGENADNGSWITAFDDHVHVKAKVCGGAIGGSPGRFKAIYRIWWEPRPPDQLRRVGSFTTSDQDEIRYEIEPNAVSNDIVEFQLCLGQGINWEKRMNLPDGGGSSWDLIVKDSKRCDTNSLWAGQVLNGQSLTFSKAKFFWQQITVVHRLPLSDLGNLPGGSRVKFTWIKD